MQKDKNGTIVLAQSAGFGSISMCSCGVVSLQLGAVTLRLEGTALVKVEHMIQGALDTLCELAAEHGVAPAATAAHVH